jgi:hypothetical protein
MKKEHEWKHKKRDRERDLPKRWLHNETKKRSEKELNRRVAFERKHNCLLTEKLYSVN